MTKCCSVKGGGKLSQYKVSSVKLPISPISALFDFENKEYLSKKPRF